jgi:MFS family permease
MPSGATTPSGWCSGGRPPLPEAGPDPSSLPTRLALRNAQVRGYCAARVFSTLATSLLAATLGWHVYDLTLSTLALGTLGLVQFIPTIPITLIGGAVADNRDRRSIVASAQAAASLAAAGLAYATGSGMATLALLLATAFALAIGRSFESPANMALLPSLVPREIYPSAVVVNATARNLGFVSGPMLSGFLVDRAGIPAAYAVASGCLAISVLLLARLRPPRKDGAMRSPISLAAIREGVAFVRSRPVVLGSMTLDMLGVVFAGSTALLPVFAREILQVGSRGYGLLAASLSIGTSLMTAILLLRRPPERPGRALFVAVAVFGLATVVFGLSRAFPLSMAALVVAGMADEVSMVARSTIIQLTTPDGLRGRVSSVNMVFIGASNELGAAESGFLAALTSATFSVVFGGFACLGVLAAVIWRIPGLRDYRIDSRAGD